MIKLLHELRLVYPPITYTYVSFASVDPRESSMLKRPAAKNGSCIFIAVGYGEKPMHLDGPHYSRSEFWQALAKLEEKLGQITGGQDIHPRERSCLYDLA